MAQKDLALGLTELGNRFHDPCERDPCIVRLREIQCEVDRAVLDAYAWNDIPSKRGFHADAGNDAGDEQNDADPFRYRWPDEVHDKVLARLLNLNQKRYAEEVAAGLHAEKGKKGSSPKRNQRRSATSSNATHPLFGSAMKSSEDV